MTNQSLFTTQTPELTNLNDAAYTLGTAFKSKVDGNVLGIRMYVSNVPTSGPAGALYIEDSYQAGSLLKNQSFGTLLPNQWNQVLFTTPYHITAGTLYIAAAGPLDVYNATPYFFSSDSFENGDLMAKITGYNGNGRFSASSSLSYPSQSFHDGCYFIDLLFQKDADASDPHLNNRDFFAAAAW